MPAARGTPGPRRSWNAFTLLALVASLAYSGKSMKHVSLAHAREHLSARVNDAAHGHQRIVLSSRGRPKPALIGMVGLERREGSDADATILEQELWLWLQRWGQAQAVESLSES